MSFVGDHHDRGGARECAKAAKQPGENLQTSELKVVFRVKLLNFHAGHAVLLALGFDSGHAMRGFGRTQRLVPRQPTARDPNLSRVQSTTRHAALLPTHAVAVTTPFPDFRSGWSLPSASQKERAVGLRHT